MNEVDVADVFGQKKLASLVVPVQKVTFSPFHIEEATVVTKNEALPFCPSPLKGRRRRGKMAKLFFLKKTFLHFLPFLCLPSLPRASVHPAILS